MKAYAFCEIGRDIGAGHLKRSIKFLERLIYSEKIETDGLLIIFDRDNLLKLNIKYKNHIIIDSLKSLYKYIPNSSLVIVDGYQQKRNKNQRQYNM